MDLKLRKKRALVTGSSRGIGRAIALSLADFKVDVAINYLRNRTRAEETAHEIEAERGQSIGPQRKRRQARSRRANLRRD